MFIVVKIVKKIFLILVALFVVASISIYCIIRYVDSSSDNYIVDLDNAPRADAIMVLGAYVYSSGEPSLVLAKRLDYGYELYKAGKAKKILVSGDNGTVQYDEVNAMKNYLLKKGVPAEDIFLDHAGFNTYDSMYRAKEIFGIKKLLVSTQQFHINRSIYIARQLGIDAYGYPSTDDVLLNIKWQNFRELLAKVKAFIDVDILKRKPKFLGEKISIDSDGKITDDKITK